MAKKNEENKQNEQLPLFDDMIDDKAIVPADEDEAVDEGAAMAVYSSNPEFNPSDITPPVLKLLQGLSAEVQDGSGKPGQLTLSGYDPQDELTLVPVSFARRRELRDVDTGAILCQSFDGEVGVGDPGGECATCPLNKWTEENGHRRPPQCQFMYSYIMYIVEYHAGAILNFKRTALPIGRSLNSIMARRGFGNVAVKISGKSKQGKRGSYFIPQLSPLPPEDEEAAIEEAKDQFFT
jgi:hypothetical protein